MNRFYDISASESAGGSQSLPELFYLDIERFMHQQSQKATRPFKLVSFEEELSDFNWACSYVIDYAGNKILQPRGFESILGFKDDEITPKLLIDGIHPDHVQLVGSLLKGALTYLGQRPELVPGAMLRLAYKRKHLKGHYLYLLSESYVRSVGLDGRILSTFTRIVDLSFLGLEMPAQWCFQVDGAEAPEFRQEVFGEFNELFTQRELNVIHYLLKGLETKEVALELGISPHTVATHRKRIYRKLDVHSLSQLMDYCGRHGIL